MGTVEKRKNERYPLRQQPSGKLSVKTGSLKYFADYIRDVSSSGISVVMNQALSSMSDVTVEYLAANGHIEIYGKVVWCKPNAPAVRSENDLPAYLLGIELLSPMTLFTLL